MVMRWKFKSRLEGNMMLIYVEFQVFKFIVLGG